MSDAPDRASRARGRRKRATHAAYAVLATIGDTMCARLPSGCARRRTRLQGKNPARRTHRFPARSGPRARLANARDRALLCPRRRNARAARRGKAAMHANAWERMGTHGNAWERMRRHADTVLSGTVGGPGAAFARDAGCFACTAFSRKTVQGTTAGCTSATGKRMVKSVISRAASRRPRARSGNILGSNCQPCTRARRKWPRASGT